MASTIIRKAKLNFNFPGPVVVDLSCYAIALEITPSTEEVDIGTFCNPSATEQGRTTYSATAAFLWEPALYAALQPYVGIQFVLAFSPDFNVSVDYVQFTSRFAAQPWGRFEVGQRVEVELPLAVLTVPTWVDGALLRIDEINPDNLPETGGTLPVEPNIEPQSEAA